MSRPRRDRGVSVLAVLAPVVAALIGGGAAVAASVALVNSNTTPDPAAPASPLQGPSQDILNYGG